MLLAGHLEVFSLRDMSHRLHGFPLRFVALAREICVIRTPEDNVHTHNHKDYV